MSSNLSIERKVERKIENKTMLRVLLVEDSAADLELILNELGRSFDITSDVVQTATEFRRKVKTMLPDVVLADYNLGQWRGTEALAILREEDLDIPLILVSGVLGDVVAVDCIKLGITDYVLKNSLGRLPVAVRAALQDRKLRQERKQAQEELRQKVEELSRSNRDLEQFAYVASHHLQEPLRVVMANTDLLAQRYRGRLDEQADKYIEHTLDGVRRMHGLIQDLLAFSRSAWQEAALRNTDCNEAVAQAMKNLPAAILESGATIKYEALPRLMANGSQLRQVFQALIGNAIRFRSPEAPVIEISAEKQGAEWMLSVADNGIGIPTEHAEDIFVIFHRLHAPSEYSGNGIGLSICKKIVERHGGNITATPRAGGGTIFKFTLPALPAST
jgi:signal transduction histidine kinase